MSLVFLSLGSNLGDRKENLMTAISKIEESIGNVISISRIYETEPWGYQSLNPFLNMAISLEAILQPFDLLAYVKKIEIEMGRDSTSNGYSDRPIDIDIIFYDDLVLESKDLTIPHPLMSKRRFVLEPMVEIAPDFQHPVLNIACRELLHRLTK